MPTAVLCYPDPDRDPEHIEFEDEVWFQDDVARIDGRRYPNVSALKVEVED